MRLLNDMLMGGCMQHTKGMEGEQSSIIAQWGKQERVEQLLTSGN